MAGKEPQDDEHIEELLSQLQGIFGKLSKTESHEAQGKIDIPIKPAGNGGPPSPPPTSASAPPPSAPASAPPQRIEIPAPVPARPMPPLEDPFALTPPAAISPDPAPVMERPAPPFEAAAPVPVVVPVSEPAPAPTSVEPVSEPTLPTLPPEPKATAPAAPPEAAPPVITDPSVIACAIFYPSLKEKEAVALKQKIETMTPRFAKVAFKLQVTLSTGYDPRSEWRDLVLSKMTQQRARALFLLVERPIDDSRRRALLAALEPMQAYFQEVPLLSLEKKAFFTDVLLGMVFFFDSLKPKSAGES